MALLLAALLVAVVIAVSLWPDSTPEVSASIEPPPPEPEFLPIKIGMPVIISSSEAPAPEPPTRPASPTPRPVGPPASMASMTSDTSPTMTSTMAPNTTDTRREPSTPAPTSQSGAEYMAHARAYMRANYQGQVQRCFSGHPGVSGTISVSLVLAPTGQVLSSRTAQNSTGNTQIGSCIAVAARSWRLPPPPRRTLEVRFNFSI